MSEGAPNPPERFLIPIPSLGVPGAWAVGRCTFHPGHEGEALISNAPPFSTKDDWNETAVREVLASAADGSVAEIHGVSDIDSAIEAVQASLDALRVFLLGRRTTHTTLFGLPGELFESRIDYVAVWKQSAVGGKYRGDYAGYMFTQTDLDDWEASETFQFVHRALNGEIESDAARRAVLGLQLLSRGALEHQSDLKVVGLMAALEAWLMVRSTGPQTFRLARRIAWFGCGMHGDDLCGRDRPACPYIRLSPDRRDDRRRIEQLRTLGESHIEWECSEWHQVLAWYDARSDGAHGQGPAAVDEQEASSAEFWILHYLAPAILEWLRRNPVDPIAHLDAAMDQTVEPTGWEQMLAALDADTPPAKPPALSWPQDSRKSSQDAH